MAGKNAYDHADKLEPILNAGLNGVWGVLIISNAKDPFNNIGINVG